MPGRPAAMALVLIAVMMLSGCTAASFAVANVPARLADIRRVAALPYGELPRQRLDVYLPASAAAEKAPGARMVIVFWYGGGWTSGNRAEYRFVGTALAQLGFVVVLPDYRLFPEVRFPTFLDDGARAVAWVQQHIGDYGGDQRRIVLMGHSAGAHMASMLVADTQYLRRAQVDTRHIVGVIGLSGPYDLRPNTSTLNAIFAPPYTAQDWQVTAQQVPAAPPTLLIHGIDDRLVLSKVSEAYAAQLRARGAAVKLRLYTHCDHVCTLAALSVPARGRASTLADVAEFLRSLPAWQSE